MPWTIKCTEKNLKQPQLAAAIIPATTNIQQIGDCIANSLLCFVIYNNAYGQPPAMELWLSFSLIYVIVRFSVAAVLGGAIFIMLPIYEQYFGFDSQALAIILALNIVLDPLITSSNVTANGGLCQVFEKIWLKIAIKNPVKS